MYSIRFSDWGLVLEFDGPVSPNIAQDWLNDVQHLTGGFTEPFHVMLDLRNAEPVEPDASTSLRHGLRVLKHAGMERAAIIVSEAHCNAWSGPLSEFKVSGLRCIVARDASAWKEQARRWLQHGSPYDADDAPTARDGV